LKKGFKMTDMPPIGTATVPSTDKRLRAVSVELEASFLAEMLKTSGLGKTPEAFGGGAGEDQFSSLLVREQARAMAERGGIGLAEAIFTSLKGKQDD
jgi:Rod binding domain-containing protein